ncbi:MAG: phage neck terminator protein [Janthinobacterium lividum]
MPNTSATGGALLPVGTQQPADLNLDLILQAVVAGALGLPGEMVRPRWQPLPPAQPPRGSDWCAIGIVSIDADTNAAMPHDGQTATEGSGQDGLIRHEQFDLLCSLYGPNGGSNAAMLRDGLAVPQNREALMAVGMAYVGADTIRRVPDLIGQGWINRADIRLTFRRKIARTYPVLNLLSADGAFNAGAGTNTFSVENPA